MTDKPLVSILTPSYNQARYLADCLASVQSQSYSPIEHIVMDGASDDGSVEVLKQSAANVKWVSAPDRGQSHALNKAFEASQGEIIGWLNSDDGYADRRAVEWAVEGLKDADVVFGHALLINETNDILQVIASAPYIDRLVRAVHYPIQPTFFFRRSALKNGFVDEALRYVMDRDLLLRLAPQARIKHLSRVIAVDRHQANRKVLSEAFMDEVRSHDETLGLKDTVLRRILANSYTSLMRLYGAPLAARLDRSLEPAFGLRMPSARDRLARQCFVKRRDMPFEDATAA